MTAIFEERPWSRTQLAAAVQVRLTPAGVQKFNAIAEGNQYKTLAIAANNKVIAAPVIDGKLIDDVLDITGVFTGTQAASLARALSK